MWNEAASVERFGSGSMGSAAITPERRTRSSELHDVLQQVEKNAAVIRELTGEIGERLLGPVPSAVDKLDTVNGGVGIIGESITILRNTERMQREALATLHRIRGDL